MKWAGGDAVESMGGVTDYHAKYLAHELTRRCAEDRRASLKAELDELDATIKETKKAARLAPNLPEKLERQRALRQLEKKRTEAWKTFDDAAREIDKQKDVLLDEISRRLEQTLEQEPLFSLRWTLS